MLWSSILKRQGHTKINKCINTYIYDCILHNTQVVQPPTENDLLKEFIEVHSEKQMVPKNIL